MDELYEENIEKEELSKKTEETEEVEQAEAKMESTVSDIEKELLEQLDKSNNEKIDLQRKLDELENSLEQEKEKNIKIKKAIEANCTEEIKYKILEEVGEEVNFAIENEEGNSEVKTDEETILGANSENIEENETSQSPVVEKSNVDNIEIENDTRKENKKVDISELVKDWSDLEEYRINQSKPNEEAEIPQKNGLVEYNGGFFNKIYLKLKELFGRDY